MFSFSCVFVALERPCPCISIRGEKKILFIPINMQVLLTVQPNVPASEMRVIKRTTTAALLLLLILLFLLYSVMEQSTLASAMDQCSSGLWLDSHLIMNQWIVFIAVVICVAIFFYCLGYKKGAKKVLKTLS